MLIYDKKESVRFPVFFFCVSNLVGLGYTCTNLREMASCGGQNQRKMLLEFIYMLKIFGIKSKALKDQYQYRFELNRT